MPQTFAASRAAKSLGLAKRANTPSNLPNFRRGTVALASWKYRGNAMSPGRSLVRSLSYIFTVRGRTGRAEFWWTASLGALGFAVLLQVPRWTEMDEKLPFDFLMIVLCLSALLSIMLLTSACRRLHDSGHHTGWILLILLPVIGWVALAALLLMRGSHGPNQYGPDPAPWRKVPRGDHPALDERADTEEQRLAEVQRYYQEMLQK
ncbi:DUF805 domain-containing protein [Gymnodinialimonas hymeniacidonis]|uniref:DUF805 domain-containing protein n=1 Tax=Gymnodinialimonas hymeniacidonis TaxID=3126508 RepID=UPI0034C5C1B1